jgi:cell division septation protein DedD
VTGPLEKGRYYIQIGAFGSESVAKDAASGVGKKFTVLIQKTSDKGKDTWRVFVGPLSRDESGVALVRVRAMGYKDAFLKSGS